METVEKLAAKAQASREAKGASPVVETVEDAIALAHAVAQQLDGLTGDARLLMLSNLDDVRRALDGRMSRLASEMDAQRAQLTAMNRSLRAIDGYGGRGAGRER
ncbi:hypothetical protein [Caulobacter sp. BP25]|uniref:hypothetical protein n=1 Tax=Caulobacter sp. BP25 TaxID=2048900 RepID=UPI000C12B750|nr:hypothetical protein [Caulobacter sp. BP25]PHY18842.1 hypothetical protein CSW59_10360 [Caulobacter sp. BP25]